MMADEATAALQPASGLFGGDPDSLGVDTDNPDSGVSSYDATAAALTAAQITGAQGTNYGYTWAFDDNTGDFIMQGNAPVKVSDVECFGEWINMALNTQRRAYTVFSEDVGMDMERCFTREIGTQVLPSFLKDEITKALAIHNRFSALDDFTCQQPDGTGDVLVTFTILTNNGETVAVTTNIGA